MAKSPRHKPAAKVKAAKRPPRVTSRKVARPLKARAAASVARTRKGKTPPNEELLRLARKYPPPDSWYSQDEEKPL
jgi:hypothetical protein